MIYTFQPDYLGAIIDMVVRLIISMPNLTLWSLPKSLVSKVLRLHRIFLYGNFSSTSNGGKTVIVDNETVFNPEKLFKVIKEKKLSIVELVPVVLRNYWTISPAYRLSKVLT